MPVFQTPTLLSLEADAKRLEVDRANTYLVSYPEFLAYFQNIATIKHHHLIIGAHFTYGWMPKILTLGKRDINQAAELLNQIKSGNSIGTGSLQLLKEIVNNSTVGLSKLLHFVNPNLCAIWDSHVAHYLLGRPCPQNWIGDLTLYRDYLQLCQGIVQLPDYKGIHEVVTEKVGYSMSSLRTLELLMFRSSQEISKSIRT